MRRILATALCLALLGAACGDDKPVRETTPTTDAPVELASTDIADIEVSGAAGEKPTLTFEQAFGVDETTRRLVTEGDGEPVAQNAVITFDFLFVNGRDGTEIGTSYGSEPAELVFEDSLMAGIYEGLDGVPAGSQVLIAIAPGDGAGADPESGLLDTDTVIFYAEIHDVRIIPQRADGEAVAPVAGLPTVELADDGAPTITVPEGEPPAELIVQPLIKGAGPVVESGQTITVHYTGVLWADGTTFDSSWESGAPARFEIGTGAVIPGWDEGLVGQTVGSQVLLVVPPAKGYPQGSPDGSISATDTLVFVIDILDAT